METVDSPTWRKSTYSNGSNTECVEAGAAERGRVLVRDTKNRDGETLAFSTQAWSAFTAGLK